MIHWNILEISVFSDGVFNLSLLFVLVRAGGRTAVQDMLNSLKICESIYFPFNKIFLEIYEELCNYYVFQGDLSFTIF